MNKENRLPKPEVKNNSLIYRTENGVEGVINPKEMTVVFEGFNEATNIIYIMNTGFPEEIGEYADKKVEKTGKHAADKIKIKLDSLIERVVNLGYGFIQVYMGKRKAGIDNNPENLQRALNLAKEKENIKLILFSAGAVAIGRENFKIPENVKEIVFVSPVIGKEIIQHPKTIEGLLNILMVWFFKIPTVEKYFESESIQQLIQRAKNNEIEVEVITTSGDTLLNQELTIAAFKKYFPEAVFSKLDGNHAPEISELGEILYGTTKK